MKLFYLTLAILSSFSFAVAHVSTDEEERIPSFQEHVTDFGKETFSNQPPLSETPQQDAVQAPKEFRKPQFSEKDFLEALLMPASYRR